MSTLIIAEHNNKTIHPATYAAVSAASRLPYPLTMLVTGFDCESVVQEAASTLGVTEVIVLDHPAWQHAVAEQISALAMSCRTDIRAVCAAGTTFGKNIIPRIAAHLDVAALSDVMRIIDPHTFERPIYAGNAIERVKSLDAIQVMTVRATAFSRKIERQTPCAIVRTDRVIDHGGSRFLGMQVSESARPPLSSARVVVSGGRGLQSAENFRLLESLADVLHAALGASRAAVDAGFISNDHQVGQTGQVVAPDLYIAVGISGAIQHVAGMKDSKVIVAINKDPDAPVFQIATYGLVGDLFEIVPKLIAGIQERYKER